MLTNYRSLFSTGSTFAASLVHGFCFYCKTLINDRISLLSQVISPALGAYLREVYGDTVIVALATAIAVLDVFFILVAVPESLPEKVRPSSWGAPISWEQADPFSVRSF